MSGIHSEPHFNSVGLCFCACGICTLRLGGAACVCLDCPCDGFGDRGTEHVPDHLLGALESVIFEVEIPAVASLRRCLTSAYGDRLPPLPSFLFDARTPAERLPTFGTYCSPPTFFPVGEPERPRLADRPPPLVSPSWSALLSSLAPPPPQGHSAGCSTSARRTNPGSRSSPTVIGPPGST